ncbi:MAG TPA: hypothetical protein VF190_11775 [Rhodothermales bacterium]
MLNRRLRASGFTGLLVVFAITAVGCGTDEPTTANTSHAVNEETTSGELSGASSEQGDDSITQTEVDAFRTALQSMPLLKALDTSPVDIGTLRHTANALVVGELLAVEDGGPVQLRQTTLQCESEEGEPTGETCVRSDEYATVNVAILVDEVRRIGDEAPVAAKGSIVKTRVVVGDLFSEQSTRASRDAVAMLIDTAPIGAKVAAFLIKDDRGDVRLAHPDAWALVDGDQLLALPVEPTRNDRGLGQVHSLQGLLANFTA